MTGTRRLQKEFREIINGNPKHFRNVELEDSDISKWRGLIVPDCCPYNKGAFKIEICIPAEYPFKPPNITFMTKIYHPNIDENGRICLSIINADNWKPTTKMDQVIEALVALVHEPEPEHPLRLDLAEEYKTNRKKFMKNAEEFTKKHSEMRPTK